VPGCPERSDNVAAADQFDGALVGADFGVHPLVEVRGCGEDAKVAVAVAESGDETGDVADADGVRVALGFEGEVDRDCLFLGEPTEAATAHDWAGPVRSPPRKGYRTAER
jgi:hypothetical protein